jgi:putative component of membrane protein insertase Oxa1/YidC/SpoIIIJ protein YidD
VVISRKTKSWAALVLAVSILLGPGAPWLLQAEIDLLRIYQQRASPLAERFIICRFDPSCSHFGLASLREFGLWKGNARIAGRLIHCSPIGFVWDSLSSTFHVPRSTI